MYLRLKIEMLKKKVTDSMIADLLQTHRNTIAYKLAGRSDFFGAELLAIQKEFFPDISIDDLMSDKAA